MSLNVQTERLDNHTARLTVEIDADRMEQAKQKAAQKLSKRYRIPGFRPGKAPYKIILNYVGEAAIFEDAVEILGDEVYKAALAESSLLPYSYGSLEDVKIDPPTFIFSVPLQPEVKLGDYRAIRMDFTGPEVSEEEFERTLKQIQQQEALVEESHQPAIMGNRVTIDIHSHFADGEERPGGAVAHDHAHEDDEDEHDDDSDEHDLDDDSDEHEVEDDSDEHEIDDSDEHDLDENEEDEEGEDSGEDENIVYKGDNFIHQHDMVVNLTDEAAAMLLPGFAEKLVGASVGSDLSFELEIPEGEQYKDVVGRKVAFDVKVKKIEVVTLPEMNDDFAMRLTQDEEQPLTLLQLRLRVRENLQKEAQRKAEEDYAEKILNQIVEQAEVAFPPPMVAERIEEMLKDLDNTLRQQNLSLETYQKVTGTTKDQLYDMYRGRAEESLSRSLVMGEILLAEKVSVTDDDINARIEDMLLAMKSDTRDSLRSLLNSERQRTSLLNNMLYERVMERLVLIGKGAAPELTAAPAETEPVPVAVTPADAAPAEIPAGE